MKSSDLQVPYFRVSVTQDEVDEVAECLRSGWLTTGPRTNLFEKKFADFLNAKYAVALNSGTAALHLAVEALGLQPGQAVLVPTMTFAATAEVVRYQNAIPILVDCDPVTLNLDLEDAERKLQALRGGELPVAANSKPVGMIPVHVGGLMMDMTAVDQFAAKHDLWVVEDAAHAFPSAIREKHDSPWRYCGQNTAAVSCYSFYANKTITTGEGGMAVTDDWKLAQRIKCMSLHGLSRDAWNRYSGSGSWDYGIVAPGYKYNATDIAASLGLRQLERAESMRQARQDIASYYTDQFQDVEQLDLPPSIPDRIHSWHLYPIRLKLDKLFVDRNMFINALRSNGVGCSVHWRPLHLHPYYLDEFGWKEEHLPVATAAWKRLISLPIFPGITDEELQHIVHVVRELCARFATDRPRTRPRRNSSAVPETVET